MVHITPDPIPAAGAALRCEYTFADPEGDQDASTVEWLVNGLVAGMGQDFSDYAAAQQVRCRVTPKDARGAQGMPVSSADRIFGAPLTEISAGFDHTCAIRDGVATCWGSGTDGKLGAGSEASVSSPQQVTGLTSNVSAISAGNSHTCVIHDGAAKCWGAAGLIGDGGSTRARTPAPVTGLTSGITTISARNAHACAIQDGAAKCWGRGPSGQLGNPAQSATTPVQVTDLLDDSTQISAGYLHTCAVHMGLVKCWGKGSEGQLGSGVIDKQVTPTTVTFP